jgi:hypothetical protein
MRYKQWVWCGVCFLWLVSTTGQAAAGAPSPAAEVANVVTASMLQPQGKFYQATVPDTLDLAERARLSVHGLTSFLDAQNHFAPWGHFAVDSATPALLDRKGGPSNWGKIAEATLKTRVMCGSTEGLDNQLRSLQGMIDHIRPVTVPNSGFVPHARAMLALAWLYQFSPTPALHDLIEEYGKAFQTAAIDGEEGTAHFTERPPHPPGNGTPFYSQHPFIEGTSARALAIWGAVSNDSSYVTLAERVCKGVMNDARFWVPEAAPKVVTPADRAQFDGHMHCYTSAMMGMIHTAELTRNARLMEFTRCAYEYQRNFGLARVGLFGEGCTTGDMTQVAIKLCDAGVGDYWEDVDCYVRNHLTELQLTDRDLLRQATQTMNGTYASHYAATDRDYTNVIDRILGTCTDDASHLTKIPQLSAVSTICGPGNVTAGMYLAWEAIVRCKNGSAQVNLLLNRASPWLDIDSYLPYEGKVVIHNKTASKLAVRIPTWANKAKVQVKLGAAVVIPAWLNNYLLLDSIHPNDTISIAFPMVTTREKYTLKWKITDWWKEVTDPGPNWTNPNPITYTMTFKGNTLVDVTPRDDGPGIPLYQRNAQRDGTVAPLKTVTRFVTSSPLGPGTRTDGCPFLH